MCSNNSENLRNSYTFSTIGTITTFYNNHIFYLKKKKTFYIYICTCLSQTLEVLNNLKIVSGFKSVVIVLVIDLNDFVPDGDNRRFAAWGNLGAVPSRLDARGLVIFVKPKVSNHYYRFAKTRRCQDRFYGIVCWNIKYF